MCYPDGKITGVRAIYASPLPRAPGRHGGCYSAWGLSDAQLKPLYSTLGHLSWFLKQRIVELLKTGSSALGQAVPQSTIVSDFNSLDLKGIKYLENARRSLQSDREVPREKTYEIVRSKTATRTTANPRAPGMIRDEEALTRSFTQTSVPCASSLKCLQQKLAHVVGAVHTAHMIGQIN